MLISPEIGCTLLCLIVFATTRNLIQLFDMRNAASIIRITLTWIDTRFSVLDHFLLSGTLFSKSVEQAYVINDPDNTSDHDPIAIKFIFELQHIGICARVYKPRVSWAKASESDMSNYRSALADRLRSFYLPKDALLCTDLRCDDLAHLKCVNIHWI